MMDIQLRYQQVLRELGQGGRGLQRFTPDEVQTLAQSLTSGPQLLPALCLAVHAAYPDRALERPLSDLLGQHLSSAELIYALNAARKHIIQARFKEGHRLELEFLERLRPLLHHADLEVVEWTLRTLEECGAQAVLLAKDVRAIRPGVFSLWRARSRTILELVTFLQRRWEPTHDPQR